MHFVLLLDPIRPNLTTSDVTNMTMQVTWTSTTGTFLTILDVQRANDTPISVTVAIENAGRFYPRHGNTALISGLATGTEYNITVDVFGREKKSEPVVITQITCENLIRNVNVIMIPQ